jgi:hypothetical protein
MIVVAFAHRRKRRLRKLFCALREQNRSLKCAVRTGVTAALSPPRGARCENKIIFYIAQRVLQTNSQMFAA